jgi:hypothetical protein
MDMSSFNDLYASSIHYLRRNGTTPAYGIRKPNSLSLSKHDEMIIALMVIVAQNPSPREIERGKVVPLQEILDNMPTRLRDGMLSWLILEGEEVPSSLIIHTGISMEDLAIFAAMRLGSTAIEKMPKGPFSFFNSSKIKKVRNNIEEAKQQAKKSTLANSEPIAHYMR